MKNLRKRLLWAGMLGVIGSKIKAVTIASLVFYILGIFYNLLCVSEAWGHGEVAAVLAVFCILVGASLSDKKSFRNPKNK